MTGCLVLGWLWAGQGPLGQRVLELIRKGQAGLVLLDEAVRITPETIYRCFVHYQINCLMLPGFGVAIGRHGMVAAMKPEALQRNCRCMHPGRDIAT